MPKVLKYESPNVKEAEFFELDEKKTHVDAEFVNAIPKCNSLYLLTGKYPERMYKKEYTSEADEHEEKWYHELKNNPPINNIRPSQKASPSGPSAAAAEASAKQAHMLKVMMNVVGAAKKVHHRLNEVGEMNIFNLKEESEEFQELDKALMQFDEFMKALDKMGSKSGVAQFGGKQV